MHAGRGQTGVSLFLPHRFYDFAYHGHDAISLFHSEFAACGGELRDLLFSYRDGQLGVMHFVVLLLAQRNIRKHIKDSLSVFDFDSEGRIRHDGDLRILRYDSRRNRFGDFETFSSSADVPAMFPKAFRCVLLPAGNAPRSALSRRRSPRRVRIFFWRLICRSESPKASATSPTVIMPSHAFMITP
jgi:hypothetical protein